MKVSLEELPTIVQEILTRLPKESDAACIIALEGTLGAGKTTFVQSVGKELGITENMQSPTYVLMKSYPISFQHADRVFSSLVHIDAYRLNNPEEFLTLKPQEFLENPDSLIFIEWPEKVRELLPKPNITVRFSSEGMGTHERTIEIESHDK